ncbi:MAG: STAS domain-containing protein [Pirellulales bacterium]|nr:STAS domain-containing protein [Planctomycetales bacterium]
MADTPESSTPKQFHVEREGDVWFVKPAADLASMKWSELPATAAEMLGAAAEVPAPAVVFDLSDQGYFGSYFLGILVRCWKHISRCGGTLGLCGVSPVGREVLEVTSLDTLWDIYPSRAEAVEAIAHR